MCHEISSLTQVLLDFVYELTYLIQNLVNTIFPSTKSSINQELGAPMHKKAKSLLFYLYIYCECSVWSFNKVRRSEIEWSSHFWGRVLFCHSGRAAFNAVKLTMITVKKRTYCSIISLFISTGPHGMTAFESASIKPVLERFCNPNLVP